MPEPMTLAEAKQVDLAVDDDAVAVAEAEAQEARQLVDALERAAIEGKDKPKNAAQAAEAKQLLDFAVKRAARTRHLADQAKAAKRLLDLEQVGKDAEAYAAKVVASDSAVKAAVSKIAEAREELLKACGDHNQQVRVLSDRCHALGGEPQPLNGILSPASAYVHIGFGGGIRTHAAEVHLVDARVIDHAVSLAASGNVHGAIRALGPLAETFGNQEAQS